MRFSYVIPTLYNLSFRYDDSYQYTVSKEIALFFTPQSFIHVRDEHVQHQESYFLETPLNREEK